MTENTGRDFCIECRKETEFYWTTKEIQRNIRNKEYSFTVTTAICTECGEEMSLPGLIDRNIQEFDDQYRAAEGIVSMEEIERLVELSKAGNTPLSLSISFNEEKISHYLDGQIPSKEHSDIIRRALSDLEKQIKA